MEFLVMAGDDDQSIYAFKGATPDAFLDPPLPASQKRVLAQSYRIPLAVHSYAEEWVGLLSRREEKVYRPRDHQGARRRLTDASEYGGRSPDFEHPQTLLSDAERYLERDQTVMFLGTCAYMLDPLVSELRARGLTFHNPYRRKNGRWNPLHVSKGVSAAGRLSAWMKLPSEWTPHDIKTWSAHMSKPKVFIRGSGEKTLDVIGQQHRPMPPEYLRRVFTDAFIDGLRVDTSDYFESLLLESKAGLYTYPVKVLNTSGIEALTATPSIMLGTIHSVKGGEADAVYLFPDLSRAGFTEYRGEGRDSIIRQMYVGMTRCREALCVTNRASIFAVQELL
jgi:superfamily I DNA/RNA helicase